MTLSAGALPGPRWGSLRRSPRPPGHPFPFAVDAFGVEAPCLTSKFQGVAAPLKMAILDLLEFWCCFVRCEVSRK